MDGITKTAKRKQGGAAPSPKKVLLLPRSVRGRPSCQRSADITQEILEKATTLFLRNGYDGTSMEAVATASGVPKKTLYKRFADKQSLLHAVLESKIASWSRVTSKDNASLSTELGERLTHRVTTMMIWAMKAEVRAVTRLAFAGLRSAGTGGVRENFFAHNEMLDVITNDIACHGPTQGIHATEPARISQGLMTLVSGWLDRQNDKHRLSEDLVRKEAKFLVDLIMSGREVW